MVNGVDIHSATVFLLVFLVKMWHEDIAFIAKQQNREAGLLCTGNSSESDQKS
jgi:hypothetical protein